MENSLIEFIATTGVSPSRIRGVCAVIDTARNGMGVCVAHDAASQVPFTAR